LKKVKAVKGDLSKLLNQNKKLFYYSNVPPVSSVSGAYSRVYSNVQLYLGLGFNITFIFTGRICESDKIDIEILNRVKYKPISSIVNNHTDNTRFEKQHKLLDYVIKLFFKESYYLRRQIIDNLTKSPYAIHHFEYIQNAVAAVGLRGNFIWSNHDNVSKRILLRRKMSIKPKSNISKLYNLFNYIKMRIFERIVLYYIKLMVTISISEKHYYQKISPQKVHYIPFSLQNKNVNAVKPQSEKIKILHLGSLNAMLPFQSLLNLMENVYPLLSKDDLSKFDLLIVGENSEGVRLSILQKEFKKYSNIKVLGFVDNLETIWNKVDLHIISSNEEIGIRTKIVESLMNKVPILCMKKTSIGLVGLKHLENIILPSTFLEMTTFVKLILSGEIQTNSIAQNGFELYKKHYSSKTNRRKMKSILIKAFNNK